MTYKIHIVPCLTDNYAFVVENTATGEAALIDAPQAAPINAEIKRLKSATLTTLLVTHHHNDHVDGIDGLDRAPDLQIIGCGADAHRLPALDRKVSVGDTIQVCGTDVQVLAADGHTINHVAYYFPVLNALFTGDSLMTHGCGRLFEGTAAQMMATITAFARLPDNTAIYSGHNYADANLAFAAQFAPDPRALSKRKADLDMCADERWPTTGTTLADEKLLNPYLRVHLPQVKASVGMPDATDLDVFTEIRTRKNNA